MGLTTNTKTASQNLIRWSRLTSINHRSSAKTALTATALLQSWNNVATFRQKPRMACNQAPSYTRAKESCLNFFFFVFSKTLNTSRIYSAAYAAVKGFSCDKPCSNCIWLTFTAPVSCKYIISRILSLARVKIDTQENISTQKANKHRIHVIRLVFKTIFEA